MQYVIMTVGKTHSGKTTLGKELIKKIPNACLLDFDILVEFFKATYPRLYKADLFKSSEEAEHAHYISLEVRNILFKEALKTSLPIIFTSANTLKKLRTQYRSLAHKANKKVIMVYLNWPEDILLHRVEKTTRTKNYLSRSTDFKDLLINRQSKIFQVPKPNEADIFLEITDDTSREKAQKTIVALVAKSK